MRTHSMCLLHCSVFVAAWSICASHPVNAQSEAEMQTQIDHLNHCTDLDNTWMNLSKEADAVSSMAACAMPTTVCTDDVKSEFAEGVARAEARYSTYNLRTMDAKQLDEFHKKQLNGILDTLRKILGDCSDLRNPKDWEAERLAEMGDTLTKLERADDAIPILRRCASVDPDFAGCFEKLGEANLVLGKRDEARMSFSKAISIGGFDEFNGVFIDTAKTMLATMNLQDQRNRTDAPEGVKSVQHSYGTGFYVSSNGDILTANHVVAGCRTLTTEDGHSVQVVSRDASADLALLSADVKPDQVAVFRSGPAPRIGDTVVTFGFPLPGILSSKGNVSTGILSASSELQNDIRFVQISAPVQPGNSGGPVFDTSGHVVGIVVAKLDALRVVQFTGDIPENVNFAVHWSEVRSLLDEQGIQYKKLPSLHVIDTHDIARIGTQISVMLDCVQ